MITLSTKDELIGFLLQYKSVAKVTIVSRTQVKMNKKDVATKTIANPFKEAWKVSMFEAEINSSYEDKVNDTLLVEGKAPVFEAKDAKWGTSLSKSIDEQNGFHYLKVMPDKNTVPSTYEDSDGKKLVYSDLEPWIPVRAPSTPDTNGQGTDATVQYRKYKIESIAYMKIPGVMEYIAP